MNGSPPKKRPEKGPQIRVLQIVTHIVDPTTDVTYPFLHPHIYIG